VQVGFDQKLLKEIPLFLMASIFGVLGFIMPSEKLLIASLPKSSAMMKRIFGDSAFVISILFSCSIYLEQEKKISKTRSSSFLIILKVRKLKIPDLKEDTSL